MKKREGTYVLTFLGLCDAVGVDAGTLRSAILAQCMERGLGTDAGTAPAIVFERDKQGRLGPGVFTEVWLDKEDK